MVERGSSPPSALGLPRPGGVLRAGAVQGPRGATNLFPPCSQLLPNSSGLNLKITDIVEGSVCDTQYQIPRTPRVDLLSTVHIAQFPGKPSGTPRNSEKSAW